MSQIDSYRHKLLGFVECPTEYPALLTTGRDSPISIALYQLEEPVEAWASKVGDVVLGGGSGECPTFRVSLPEAAAFLNDHQLSEFDNRSELYQSYWRPEEAFALCNGFLKLGWRPADDIETWLAEHIVAFMSSASSTQLSVAGSFFRSAHVEPRHEP